jgi:8-oxo-dGTP pyrophosphatase MutT (NUDIX family)
MPDEKSCGVVLFRTEPGRMYLLLHYEEGHWDFPKGHVEEGEGEHEAAARETAEETGIGDMDFVFGFRERIEYFYKRGGRLMNKEVFFFLARTETSNVTLSKEHIGFEWLTYLEALARLTYPNAKEILSKAEKYLEANQ